ncbi:MAG: hypothetical protein WDM91_21265 [Rhizomicrobium sp.]
MPSHLQSAALFGVLRVRARTVVPLANAWRRVLAAAASGTRRQERLADIAWRKGDGLAAIAHWRALEQEQPRKAEWPLKIAQAVKERGDIEGAERILLDARARGIAHERIDLDLLRYGRLWRRSNSAVAEAEAIVADPRSSATKLFFSAYYLMSQNRLEPARDGFARVLDDKHYRGLAQGHLAAIARLAQNRAKGRPDIPGWLSAAQSSFVVREPSSDTLVVGFALPEGTLGSSVNAVHAMLSSNGVNGLYLYDSRQLFHLAGTDRFGPGYQAMIDGIRALAAELGTRRLITIGGSATGYTAIRAAMDLGADGAVVFSPATMMISTANPALTRGAHTLFRLRENVLPMMAPLRPLIQARPGGLRVDAYYSAANRRDVMHAAHLAGLEGVDLIPVAGHKRHDCLTEMSLRGYEDLLERFWSRKPAVS